MRHKFVFIFAIFALHHTISAQSWIFTYDNAGNRVRRELAEQKSMTEFQQDSAAVVMQDEQLEEIALVRIRRTI